MLVRLPRSQGLDQSVSPQPDERDGSTDHVSPADGRTPEFEDAVFDYLELPKHSLYALEIDTEIQSQMSEHIRKRGGVILSVGRPSKIRSTLFTLRTLSTVIMALMFSIGLLVVVTTLGLVFGPSPTQYAKLGLLLSAFVIIAFLRLVRNRLWLWLERHLHFFAPS